MRVCPFSGQSLKKSGFAMVYMAHHSDIHDWLKCVNIVAFFLLRHQVYVLNEELLLRFSRGEDLGKRLLSCLCDLEVDLGDLVMDLVAAHGLLHRDSLLRAGKTDSPKDGDLLSLAKDAASHGKSAVIGSSGHGEFIARKSEGIPLDVLADIDADERPCLIVLDLL